MEKRTLLEIVNDVAASMDYETVSDIGETPESEQIARIARSAYYELLSKDDWPHLKTLVQLQALNDPAKPNFLKVPDDIAEVWNIRYNTTPFGEDKQTSRPIRFYAHPSDFIEKILGRDTTAPNVIEVEYNNIPLYIRNDRPPKYCTTFDDQYIVFDSFDENVDSTLQSSRVLVEGLRSPPWSASNTFTPDLPARLFPVYVSKVRILANSYLRQVRVREDEYDNRTGMNRLRRKMRVSQPIRRVHYGRRQP